MATAGSITGLSKMPKEVDQVIKKLQQDSERPQDAFREVLNEYAEVDQDLWETQFPLGYRERRAPGFFGEVYATGKTGKAWAKEFIRDHHLGDCTQARELIPTMAAADSMILKDKGKGVINSVALERLAKKGLGIWKAYRHCQARGDWENPASTKP